MGNKGIVDMATKIVFNWLLGIFGFVFTFIISIRTNLLMTSLIRATLAFVVWFVLAFALRWVIGLLRQTSAELSSQDQSTLLVDTDKGNLLDLTTPDESDELKNLLQQTPELQDTDSNDFTPLDVPRLVKTKNTKDPEELAKAVRHLTEQ